MLVPHTDFNLQGPQPMEGFEALLSSVLGPRANKEGSFKLVKADVSAQTFVKIGFAVQKKIKEGDLVGFPEWRTKPHNVRMHFEVLAKLDGNKVLPERVVQIQPVIAEDSVAQSVLTGNITIFKIPIVHHPPNPFQNLIKVMIDANPVKRPSPREIIDNSIFDRIQRIIKGAGSKNSYRRSLCL